MTSMPFMALMAPEVCVCEPGACLTECVCPDEEQAVRAYAYGVLSEMSLSCREECLDEIAMVEGYDRTEYEHADSNTLAWTVIHAWTDYCRDKGLI